MSLAPVLPAASIHAFASRRLLAATMAGATAGTTRIDLVLAGARGQVGSALRRQLAGRQAWLREHAGLDLRLLAAFDRRGFAHDLQGLDPAQIEASLRPRNAQDAELLLASLSRPGRQAALLVDCTACDEIADWYSPLLAAGTGVVTANKRANARPLAQYRQLQVLSRARGTPYRYETNVGAAIPVLGPIRDLRLRGERIHSLQGVLSGSLSHILHRLHEGCAFSEAVAEARRLGLTEPDPREDLGAQDLARKLLVLGREAGFALEVESLRIEPLFDDGGRIDASLEQLLAQEDATWRERVAAAQARCERLVVLAEVDGEGGRVGVRSLPLTSPFAALQPGQNLVLVRTDLQQRTPLALGGPGAGAEITAAGLLSDIIAAGEQLAPR
jgi:aspartokinase/homoserine dehydrogenase 1